MAQDFPSCDTGGPWGLTSFQNKHQVFGANTKRDTKKEME